jgi:hypothetical protein
MRDPRRLTILWDFMACYRDSFTFYILACVSVLIVLFDTTRDYTSQFTITHTPVSTVTSSLAVGW